MMAILMKREHSTIWKMHEWKYLGRLLSKGYPLFDSLHILQKDTGKLKEEMLKGIDMKEILLTYAQPHLQKHLAFFLSITSFANAITCAIRMNEMEIEMKKKLKKDCAYPIFIFFFAYVTLCLFIQYVIPQLLLSFPIESMDLFFIISMKFLQLLCVNITVLLIGLASFMIMWKFKGCPRKFLLKFMRTTFGKEYISYTFGSYLKELDQDGLSTKKAITFLSNTSSKQMLSLFMCDLKQQMEEGNELTNVIQTHPSLCPMFQTCFTIGVKTSNITQSIEDFIIFQEEQWHIKIQRIGMVMQCTSYGFVGFLVIMVYQIMLVPLQLIETM